MTEPCNCPPCPCPVHGADASSGRSSRVNAHEEVVKDKEENDEEDRRFIDELDVYPFSWDDDD